MLQQIDEVTDGLLAVRSTPYGGEVVTVSLRGELDRANVGSAERAIEAVMIQEGIRLVIDLADLEFLDCSGVALLWKVGRHPDAESRVRVIPSDFLGVGKILSLAAVDSRLRIVKDGGN